MSAPYAFLRGKSVFVFLSEFGARGIFLLDSGFRVFYSYGEMKNGKGEETV